MDLKKYWVVCAVSTLALFVIFYALSWIYTFHFYQQYYELTNLVFPILRIASLLVFVPFLFVVLMKWKNQPYWLRGGAIGIIFYFFIFILFAIMKESSFGIAIILGVVLYIPNMIVTYIISFIPRLIGFKTPGIFMDIISGGVSCLITGILIGWLVGKIKSRKNKSLQKQIHS